MPESRKSCTVRPEMFVAVAGAADEAMLPVVATMPIVALCAWPEMVRGALAPLVMVFAALFSVMPDLPAATLMVTAPVSVVRVKSFGSTNGNVSPVLTVAGPRMVIFVAPAGLAPMTWSARVTVLKAHPATEEPVPLSLPPFGSTVYWPLLTTGQDVQTLSTQAA